MNYIKELADRIRNEIPESILPEADNIDDLMNIYAVLALAKRDRITNEDIHNAWAAWMNNSNPDHKSISPYNELTDNIQAQDTPFKEAILRAIS